MDLELQRINEQELNNDVVTVSMLQIALRADARRLQTLLNEAAMSADTTTVEGLFVLLQQVSRALLDYSRYWTHVLASSQTFNTIAEAEVLYNQLLDRERAKFNAETLTNVNGVITQQPLIAIDPRDEPSFIVVTLLLGTADDQPLFGEIYSTSVLRDVLDDIRTMQPRYLMVFDVLWSPQDERGSLTEADMAAEYADLVPI